MAGRMDSGPGDGEFLLFPGLNSYDSKSHPISDRHVPTSPAQPTAAEAAPFLRSTGCRLPPLKARLGRVPLFAPMSLSIHSTPSAFYGHKKHLFL